MYDSTSVVVSVEVLSDKPTTTITNLVGVYQHDSLIDMYIQELQPSFDYLESLVDQSYTSISKYEFLTGFEGQLVLKRLDGTILSERPVNTSGAGGRMPSDGIWLEEVTVTAKKIENAFCRCVDTFTWAYEEDYSDYYNYDDNFDMENGGGSPGSSPTTAIVIDELEPISLEEFMAELWEKRNIELSEAFEDNPCAKKVWDVLSEKNTMHSVLNDYINNTFDLDLNYQLDIEQFPCGRIQNACTDHRNTDDNVPTYFRTAYLNGASPLSVARTMLHEAIHAHLIYYLKVVERVDNQNWEDFPTLWAYMEEHNYSMKYASHELMADAYRTTIEQGLKEFDNSQNSDFYKKMAWAGLQGTDAWENLSETERNNIEEIIDEEQNKGGCN